jgi:hypothetical protein
MGRNTKQIRLTEYGLPRSATIAGNFNLQNVLTRFPTLHLSLLIIKTGKIGNIKRHRKDDFFFETRNRFSKFFSWLS